MSVQTKKRKMQNQLVKFSGKTSPENVLRFLNKQLQPGANATIKIESEQIFSSLNFLDFALGNLSALVDGVILFLVDTDIRRAFLELCTSVR